MAKNTYGKFGEFDLSSTGQDWTEYCEQMDFYFSPNMVTDDKQQKAILLPTVGNEAFKLIAETSLAEPTSNERKLPWI